MDLDQLTASARAFRVDETAGELPIELVCERPAEGVRTLSAEAEAESSLAVGLVLPCSLDEHFAGLGEQFRQVDKRGRVIDGWLGASVNCSTFLAPGLDGGYKVWSLFFSSAGYAALIDTTRRFQIDFAVRNPRQVTIKVPGTALRVQLFEGAPERAIPLVTAVSGRPPLAPPWAYGVWKATQSGSEQVLADAERLRRERLPCSALWFYDFYDLACGFGGGAASTGTYPRGDYPDLPALTAELHERGYKAMGYLTPYLYRSTPAFEEAVAAGYLMRRSDGSPALLDVLHPFEGDDWGFLEEQGLHSLVEGAGQIDLTNPRARRFWQARLRGVLCDLGFDGWMEDFGEGVPAGAVLSDGMGEDEAHNRFPLLYHEAAAEEIRRSKPDAVFFARGGWTGAQAYAPAFWPGDQTRDWSAESGIAAVIPAGISIGLMGVAAWGPDIGGCMGFPSLPTGMAGSADKELWIRWCQLGAMSPVMRDHPGFHSGKPVDLWSDAETIEIWRACASWHIRLFPYLYSCAAKAASCGLPILRGLMIAFPEDPECWTLTDQYLLGAALLCAPVVRKGERRRPVYLPEGDWYDIWTNEVHHGPGAVTLDAPLEHWPVLQRSGSVVARLATTPMHLNDECYARGELDLELAVAAGKSATDVLFDGTEVSLSGRRLRIVGPERRRTYRVTDPAGNLLAEAAGQGELEIEW